MDLNKFGIHAVGLARRHASRRACRLLAKLGIYASLVSKGWLTLLGLLRPCAELTVHAARLAKWLAPVRAFRLVKKLGSYTMIVAWLLAFGASSLANASTMVTMEEPVAVFMTAPAHVLPYPQPQCSKCKAVAARQTDPSGARTLVLSLAGDVLPQGFVGRIRVTMLFSGHPPHEQIFDVAIVEDELTLTITEPVTASWQSLDLLWVELLPAS